MIAPRAALAAIFSLLLGACATPVPQAPAWGGAALSPAWAEPLPPDARGADADWWQAWGDPLLVQLVAAAEAANTDIAIARANLRGARAARAEAAAALWPQASASLSAQRAAPAGASARKDFQLGLDASWELDLFGDPRLGGRRSGAGLFAAAPGAGARGDRAREPGRPGGHPSDQ